MDPARNDFAVLVGRLVRRMARQQDQAVSEPTVEQFSRRLAEVMSTCALPPPLPPDDPGRPDGLAESVGAPLVAAVMGDQRDVFLTELARQVIKACLHPPFTRCRDSYRERAADGRCRRQERERTRLRVSGAPCVDCPYWTGLEEAGHGRLLDAGWVGASADWRAEADLYLPEDFRRLRVWVRRRAGERVACRSHRGSA
jgi:hypothetical protein